ncbi:putative transcriptional regulator YvhJ [Meiothermus granaticius NBRC 107808]|uniref:Putative transcriptional regulator YvhJ n=1 Tax=Meiothermus granaticius NBRC 107808 TaxID=1227551 RepID=A0A399FB63_9DEIN|nr:putative transcriptional regulator YvhJ [Meiothermus granaticius NBRC 107808]
MARVSPRPRVRSRRGPRVSLLVLGLALLGLAGVLALAPEAEGPLQAMGTGQPLQAPVQAPELSLVVAARDTEYCGYHLACGPGNRTDTIFYLRLRGAEATLVAIPRDLRYTTEGYSGKINTMYERRGAEGLRQAVEEVLGMPVQHHLILTFNAVMRLVNAVDGVEVTLPYPMKYTDRAAGLYIDFPAGRIHLDGKDAVKYMRFRRWEGSDLGRLDRIKDVLGQVAQKAQSPRYWSRLPGVASATWKELETSLSLPMVLGLLPELRGLNLRSATLPTLEQGNDLIVDEAARASLVSGLLGYAADHEVMARLTQAKAQGLKVLLLDGSSNGQGKRYRQGLAQLGLPLPDLQVGEVRGASAVYVRSGVSVVGRESPAFALARDYADLFQLPLQSRIRLEPAGYDVIVALGSG